MSDNNNKKKKSVLVPIAHGSEEIETTCITDTLTRFGADVTIASANANGDELMCVMSRGIQVQADTSVQALLAADDVSFDLIVLPGGMPGAEHLRDCEALTKLLKKQKDAGKLYGAICAAPAVALQANGFVDPSSRATCYPAPGFTDKLGTTYAGTDKPVVVSGNLVTSQGPGTALHFALELGEQLFGKEKRQEIAKQMLVE